MSALTKVEFARSARNGDTVWVAGCHDACLQSSLKKPAFLQS